VDQSLSTYASPSQHPHSQVTLDCDGMGSIPAIPEAQNVPLLLCHERFNEASLPEVVPSDRSERAVVWCALRVAVQGWIEVSRAPCYYLSVVAWAQGLLLAEVIDRAHHSRSQPHSAGHEVVAQMVAGDPQRLAGSSRGAWREVRCSKQSELSDSHEQKSHSPGNSKIITSNRCCATVVCASSPTIENDMKPSLSIPFDCHGRAGSLG
jgi:hypothetical protein